MSAMQSMMNHPPCKKCGYDLRATPVGTPCPECGEPVPPALYGIRVESNRLVVRSGVALPPRCVKTNEPVMEKQRTKTLSWAPPWVYAFLLINLIVLLIVYLVVRKQCTLSYSISKQSQSRVVMMNAIAWLTVIGGLFAIVAGAATELPVMIVAGIVMFFGGLIFAVIASGTISVTGHRDGEFWIKGCCPEFLSSVETEIYGDQIAVPPPLPPTFRPHG